MTTLVDTQAHARTGAGVTVPLLAFRQALMAVKPHVAASNSPLVELQRLRLLPDADHVMVMAADNRTVACARVRVEQVTTGVVDPIDIDPADVAKVLAVFKMPQDKDLWPSTFVRLEHDDRAGELTVVDAAGMFDGQSLTIPVGAPSPQFPPLLKLLYTHLRLADVRDAQAVPDPYRGVSTASWTRLQAATKAYDEPVWLRATDKDGKAPLLALVGPSFIAVVNASTPDEHSMHTPRQWRREWEKILYFDTASEDHDEEEEER